MKPYPTLLQVSIIAANLLNLNIRTFGGRLLIDVKQGVCDYGGGNTVVAVLNTGVEHQG